MVRGAERRTLLSGLANPSEFLVEALSTGRTLSGAARDRRPKAFGLAPVWSAVSIIAETLGGLPLKVYRDIGDGDRVAARDHRAYRMLHDQPNPVVPAFRFWSTCAVHLLLRGNAFIEKLRGASGSSRSSGCSIRRSLSSTGIRACGGSGSCRTRRRAGGSGRRRTCCTSRVCRRTG
jgi:hypothetical protein